MYLPSENEIKKRCAEIRATWSEEERLERMAQPVSVTPGPRVISTRNLPRHLAAELTGELHSWVYPDGNTEPVKPTPTPTSSESNEVNDDDDEHFDAFVVKFGN